MKVTIEIDAAVASEFAKTAAPSIGAGAAMRIACERSLAAQADEMAMAEVEACLTRHIMMRKAPLRPHVLAMFSEPDFRQAARIILAGYLGD